MRQDFFIPFRFPGLNDYIKAERGNKYVAAKMKLEYTNIAKLYCQYSNLQPYTLPVKVGFTFHEPNNKRDPDNIVFGKKFILDGMVKAGLIENDNQYWIRGILFERWFQVPQEEVGVTVTIMEAQHAREKRY